MPLPAMFDCHCDTVSQALRFDRGLRENDGHLDLLRASRFEKYAQFFAIFSPVKMVSDPWGEVCKQYDLFCRELKSNADLAVHCRTAAEAEEAFRSHKTAAFLAVEDSGLLECSLDRLEEAYKMGVRAVNLTWNFENAVSGTNAEGADKGLTEHGRAFVRRMTELGMLVDVSHLSDPGFWDVAEIVKGPFIAGHSNARALCPHSRNLTDEQFREICAHGGIAGLNVYADFLGEDPTIDTMVDHVEHFLTLGGEKSVALGGDWDGCERLPAGLHGIEDMGTFYEKMLRRNYPETLVQDLFFGNLMRVVRQVCTM